jgi:hypothetical protein
MNEFEGFTYRFGELELRCIYVPSPNDNGLSWSGEVWRENELIYRRYFFRQSDIKPFMAKIFILTGDSDE